MAITEAIKRGFSVVHRNMQLLLILFVFNLVSALARLPFTQQITQAAPGAPPQFSAPAAVMGLIFGLVGIFVFGGVLGCVNDYIRTQVAVLNKFVDYGFKYYFRILAIWVLVALIILIFIFFAAFGMALAIATRNLVAVTLAVALALIIGAIGIYLFILLLLAPYIAVADDIGPVTALKKSISFVRSNLLKILGLFILLILISIGIGFAIGIIIGVLTLAIRGAAGQLLIALLASAFNAYINILMPACFLLMYLSLRRAEGPVAAPSSPEPPPAPST